MDGNVVTAVQHLNLTQVITAIGGLGTAAFGLLEALKPVCPLINHIGFGKISNTVRGLTPPETGDKLPANSLPGAKIIDSIESNWINGTDLASQKAIAKSLIKLHMSEGNAAALAAATNVDSQTLTTVAKKIVSGAPLVQAESDVYSRFDLIVTATLDECYQRADQDYRNWTRALAAFIAVILALAGGYLIQPPDQAAHTTICAYLGSSDCIRAVLVGLLATPLAPVAKDISTALATAVNTMQLVKK